MATAFVVGVGMTKFEKPCTKKWDYPDMGSAAASDAISDAKLNYEDMQAAVASYCYGDPTCGQRALYELGLTGIPIFNTNNNCSSASSALMLARALVLSGYDCVLAVGFEKMDRGLSEKYTDKTSPIKKHVDTLVEMGADPGLVQPYFNAVTSDVIKMFGYAAMDHCRQHGTTVDHFAKITYKNRRHGAMNDRACFQSPVTLDFVKSKRQLCGPITVPMSAPTADGGAAAVVCSEKFMIRNGLQDRAVEILSQHMVTDLPSSFGQNFLNLCGYSMSQEAAEKCFKDAGITINDVDLVELHDCFSPNELFLYEALGMCPEGHGGKLIDSSKWIKNSAGGEICVIGDRWVVNTSGGLESKGHPIGATGLGQCTELVWQLRGVAGKRQLDGARIGLQQNFGIGGAAVVTIYRKFDGKSSVPQARL